MRLPRTRRLWWLCGGLVLAIAVAAGIAVLAGSEPGVRVSNRLIAATAEAGAPVSLDTALYLPDHTPAPAVLLAHGFGGSKSDLDSQARSLARHGYVVMTYTARGFGASGGLIHLDSLDYEVADACKLLDALQNNPAVLTRNGKPVIGVAGSSYGGGLALMLGATDHRISAVAADITWNNLATALFPNRAVLDGQSAPSGVFKKLWAGYLFGDGFDDLTANAANPACGRFAPQVCALYQKASQTGVLSADFAGLLARSSPASVLGEAKAPTLLTQGEQDSLFDLDQADANARALAAAGAPVTVRWRSGGHDAPGDNDNVARLQRAFFDRVLKRGVSQQPAGSNFTYDQRNAAISASDGKQETLTLRARSSYQGVNGAAADQREVALAGGSQTISAPAGGAPAAVTSVPALGSALSAASAFGVSASAGLSQLPGQTAVFYSQPLADSVLVAGASTIALRVTASTDTVVFVSLRDISPDGSNSLSAQLVSPIRLTKSAAPTTVTVTLPAIVARVPSGHRVAVVVSSTDIAYQMPADPRTYTVALAGQLTLATVPAASITSSGTTVWVIIAAVVAVLAFACTGWRLRRMRRGSQDSSLADVPVVVTDLVKEYADGYRAVDGVSFRVERGQVLGLLGPNGAGKTTTLRVLMGLILPTAGTVRVFGHEVVPGAPVLARLGAFVEGPGLLPHLSGAENLSLYWAASGRPGAEAELDTVLEIAGLGPSLRRRVKSYSHGMQQRLAIAQAMLGLPEVLVLDEPTNGLDPPQIAEMRQVLHRYAQTGRTVIVSSHLLAEVEQTCTHVVVMHRGRLVAAGSVDEVAGASTDQLAVADPDAAREILAAAGVHATTVPARRALEDVFLDLIGESPL